uniref:Uncharacterized protein n=1 Tax=Aegilops tauschii TaxID=37682 RepID=M8CG27_AEGTA
MEHGGSTTLDRMAAARVDTRRFLVKHGTMAGEVVCQGRQCYEESGQLAGFTDVPDQLGEKMALQRLLARSIPCAALSWYLCHKVIVVYWQISSNKNTNRCYQRKVGQHYLGSSEAGVYFANLRDRIPIWYLIEPFNGEVKWVLKKSNGLVQPTASISSLNPKGICRPWIFDDDPDLDRYGNNKRLEKVVLDWNWDDDNILDECGRRSGHCPLLGCQLLGFHPYKEIAFFLMERFEVWLIILIAQKFSI